MKYIEVAAHGQVLSCGIAGVSDIALVACRPGASAIEYEGYCEPGWVFSGGVATPLPTKPSQSHQYNYALGVWELDSVDAWNRVRNQRQQLLQASDWATLPDVPLTTEQRAQWVAYRQALRDVTAQTDPLAIVWPVAPG